VFTNGVNLCHLCNPVGCTRFARSPSTLRGCIFRNHLISPSPHTVIFFTGERRLVVLVVCVLALVVYEIAQQMAGRCISTVRSTEHGLYPVAKKRSAGK